VLRLYSVSIPHRFNSHFVFFVFVFLFSEFQSLTGSIHTLVAFGCFFFTQKFQSLTGSIHTKVMELASDILIKFQSLTGSIHTFFAVSIPHRFNSHILAVLR
jgi:hypothetical protein